MSEPFWTEERIAELKTRWLNWESFAEIAIALGHKSRNAVIGKAHRLGLKREVIDIDNRPVRPQGGPRLRRVRHRHNGHHHHFGGEPITMSEDDAPPGFADPKPFIELGPSDCRWPGAGAVTHELLCCAAPVFGAYPYCLAHCRIAYVPPFRRRVS